MFSSAAPNVTLFAKDYTSPRALRSNLQWSGMILDNRFSATVDATYSRNMDGWGQPWLKFDTYARCEVAEPVQFTGFKLFYHNDTRKGDRLLSPVEVLALRPRPIYIQYQ